jgi:asparagine synthetase B (glutamine-hydrolysing)
MRALESQGSTPALTNWIWREEEPAPEPDLFASEGVAEALAGISGQFALHQARGGTHRLVRDPLGVNKLFFSSSREEGVIAANQLIELLRRGLPIESVFSVPSGHWLELRPERRELALGKWSPLRFGNGSADPQAAIAEHAVRIQRALESAFRRLRAALPGRQLYVTLSGGLDSTAIAVMAREWLGEFVAVSFSVAGGAQAPSDDLACAERVARELGVPLEVVAVEPDDLLDLVDTVLLHGQDWRDFNVHCGLVNAAIGAGLAGRQGPAASPSRPVVLTGDVMNELMADYTPVTYRRSAYYALPDMPPDRLRRFLVSGLDSGDREVGIFAHYGLDAIQPYALCAEAYAALPGVCLADEAAKPRLVRAVLGSRIPAFVYERPKVRAQVASEHGVGGTLAVLVDAGLDQEVLSQRFAELHGIPAGELPRLIRAGFYRFPTRFPEDPPSV